MIENVDFFLPVSEKAAACLELAGVNPNRMKIVPAGVDLNNFQPQSEKKVLREEFNIPQDKLFFISVGRFDWSKGHQDLISGLAYLIQKNPEYKEKIVLKLIGQGKFKPFLQELINQYELNSVVELVDFLPYESLPKWYSAADLFILLSTIEHGWQEQFGLVFAEAQACGLPILTTDTGSIAEVVAPESYLIPPSDFLQLANKLQEIIQNPNQLQIIAQKSLAFAKDRYDSSKICSQLAEVYHSLSD